MLSRKHQNERGAASIIVVIFMSIILTIVTIGFLRIALNEQRIATDDDLTSRAFYAAESGIEDVRRAVRENLAGTLSDAQLEADNCDVPSATGYERVLSPIDEFDTEITCMRVDFTPETIRSELGTANQTRQFEINPVNPSGGTTVIDDITLRWHIDAPVGSAGGNGDIPGTVGLRGNQTTIPPGSGTTWSFPAMMQVQFISYPTSNIARGDIISSTVWVSPGTGSGSSSAIFGAGGASIVDSVDGAVLVADCADNDNDYACSMEFDVGTFPDSRNLEIRVTNLYEAASIEFSMNATNGDALLFDDVQVVADVTGRAGAVYRRVEAVLDLTSPDLLPEFTIQSAEDICKDFAFTDDINDFDGQLDSSCKT